MTRKSLMFALGVEALLMAALLVVALDQYAHKRVQMLGGVNSWGYRAAVAPQRRPHEIRLVVVGGDHAFAFGVAPPETTTMYLRQRIERLAPDPRRSGVTAINLGALGLAASAYAERIERFADIAPDVVCIYVDLGRLATDVRLAQLESGVGVLTGYVPVLPLVLEEKGTAMADRGSAVFGPIVHATGRVLRRMDRLVFHRLARIDAPDPERDAASVVEAVGSALSLASGVVVAIPSPRGPAARRESDALQQALEIRYSSEPRVRVVALGQPPMDYSDDLLIDGVNFGAAGQWKAAQEIAPAVIDLLRVAGLLAVVS